MCHFASEAQRGKKHSEETKQKISKSKKGKPVKDKSKYHKGWSWKVVDGKRVWYKND